MISVIGFLFFLFFLVLTSWLVCYLINRKSKKHIEQVSVKPKSEKNYPEIPFELMGDYYRGKLRKAKPCKRCNNTDIYVGISVDESMEFAYCIKCENHAELSKWQRQRNLMEDLEFNERHTE